MSRSSKNMTLINYLLENQAEHKKLTVKMGGVGAGLGFMFWMSVPGPVRAKMPVYLFILAGSMLSITLTTATNLYHTWKIFPEVKQQRQKSEQRYKDILEYKIGTDAFLNEVRAVLVVRQQISARLSQPIDEFKYVINSKAAEIDAKANAMQEKIPENEIVNNGWKCVITQQLVRDPVKANDGFIYERHALQHWFDLGKKTCIINRDMKLSNPQRMVTDDQLQNAILDFLANLASSASLKKG